MQPIVQSLPHSFAFYFKCKCCRSQLLSSLSLFLSPPTPYFQNSSIYHKRSVKFYVCMSYLEVFYKYEICYKFISTVLDSSLTLLYVFRIWYLTNYSLSWYTKELIERSLLLLVLSLSLFKTALLCYSEFPCPFTSIVLKYAGVCDGV